MKTRSDCICNKMQLFRIFLFQVYFYMYFQNILSSFLGMISNNILTVKISHSLPRKGMGCLIKSKQDNLPSCSSFGVLDKYKYLYYKNNPIATFSNPLIHLTTKLYVPQT